MKNSRTSKTNTKSKKVVSTNKKVSASPTSANKKKVVKKAPQKSQQKQQIKKQPVKKVAKKNIQQQPKRPVKMVKKDTRNPNNNIRLKTMEDDVDFVPFFENEEYVEEIVPNRIRKVEPERIEKIDEAEEIRKIRKRAISVLKFSFATAILIGVIYLLFTLEGFNLKEIKVKGNDKYTAQEIINKSNLKIGENVFKQLLLVADKNIGLSYVSSSRYSYEAPNIITISVKERYPAYLALDNKSKKYYKLDNEGYILEEGEPTNNTDVLLIEGIAFDGNIVFGEQISDMYLKKLDIYTKIKKTLEKYDISGNITKVNFTASLTTIVLDDKLKITFADDSNIDYKVSFLKGIIQKNGGQVEGRIDMSIENPVYSKYD